MQFARQFLSGIIDYAGLFPPASLTMADAVGSYSEYKTGADSDLLARFIVPATRLDELRAALDSISVDPRNPWQLGVIAGKRFAESRDAALSFNAANRDRAICNAIEILVPEASGVREVISDQSDALDLFIEVPAAADPEPFAAELAGTGASAKIRTGGVTAGAIPAAETVLRFLTACHRHSVPFKATAGLHHVVRSEYPLTYENDSPLGEMFGYLNVFLAAAALDAGWGQEDALAILEERDASCFVFDDGGVGVNGRRIDTLQLIRTRRCFAKSFGSCSFVEPVTEARALGLV